MFIAASSVTKCLNTYRPDDVNLTFAVLTYIPPGSTLVEDQRGQSWVARLYPALRTLYTPMHTPLIQISHCMCRGGGGVRFIISKMCSYTTAEFP